MSLYWSGNSSTFNFICFNLDLIRIIFHTLFFQDNWKISFKVQNLRSAQCDNNDKVATFLPLEPNRCCDGQQAFLNYENFHLSGRKKLLVMSSLRPEISALPPDVAAKIKSSTSITHLNGVILELIKNALDANATTIHISVDFKRGGCIVEDNGSGIAPAEFEPTGGLGKAHRMPL